MPEIKELVIDRALWGPFKLLREDGRMCCLGHLGLACGVPKTAMLNRALPCDLNKERRLYPMSPTICDENWVSVCSAINDSRHSSLEEKEAKLIKAFSDFRGDGIKLSFIGEHISGDWYFEEYLEP